MAVDIPILEAMNQRRLEFISHEEHKTLALDIAYIDVDVIRNANCFTEQVDPLAQVRKLPHISNAV